MVLGIQHAAAIAYIGDKEEAKRRIQALHDRPEYAPFRTRFLEPRAHEPDLHAGRRASPRLAGAPAMSPERRAG